MEIKELTITRVYQSEKNKGGEPFISKNGKPYMRVGITTQELGDEIWLSCISFNENDHARRIKEGDVIKVGVEKKGDFWNFKFPEKDDEWKSSIERRLSALESKFGIEKTL